MKLTRNKKRFAEWMALPETMRHPTTLEDLAESMKVRVRTLMRWEKEAGFQDLVAELAHQRLDRVIPEVIQVIIDAAFKADFRFVKLILELTGNDKMKISTGDLQSTLSLEEFSAVIRQVEAWKRERFDPQLHVINPSDI